MLTTTFTLLRGHRACKPGYKKLARHLGGVRKYGAERPISLATVLESNGLEDTLWCLQAVPEPQQGARDRLARLLACDYAEHVLPIWEVKYPLDKRPRQAIETARAFANGLATKDQLAAARDAAGAARAAAGDAAWVAARAAAWVAARDAAWVAAGAAAWAAARAAARVAAGDAEIKWQTAKLREHLRAESIAAAEGEASHAG